MPTGAFNPILLYGLMPQFSATLLTNGSAVPTSCPFMWMNGTQTISVLPTIAQATTSSALSNGLVSAHISHCLLYPRSLSTVPTIVPASSAFERPGEDDKMRS